MDCPTCGIAIGELVCYDPVDFNPVLTYAHVAACGHRVCIGLDADGYVVISSISGRARPLLKQAAAGIFAMETVLHRRRVRARAASA